MFDARDLLGNLMQAGGTRSANDRLSHAMGPNGLGRGGNPLGDLLGSVLGGGAASGRGAGGGGFERGGFGGAGGGGLERGGFGGGAGGGLSDVLSQAGLMFGGPSGGRDALATGGLAALAGALLGGRRAGMKGAVGAGLMALLGSMAFSAMRNRQAGGAPAGTGMSQPSAETLPVGLREPQTPAEEEQLQHTALLAVRAMINAAKADGAIDGGEMGRIMSKLKEQDADNEARDFVMEELQKPFDLDALVREVKTAEEAVQVYGASLLAIEVDTPAERAYLQSLAQRLQLDAETVHTVHETLGVPKAG